MLEDDKLFSAMKKDVNSFEEKCYWIGKSSMRSWKRLVLEQIEEMAASERKKRRSSQKSLSESELEDISKAELDSSTKEEMNVDAQNAANEKKAEDESAGTCRQQKIYR